MADVFISYKREDRPSAERLSIVLEQLGFEVWWDFDLLSGDRYRSVIRKVIDECHVAVVLWSTRAVQSDFVMDEAEYAKAQGKLCPARIDSVELPFGFGSLHTDDLSAWDSELFDPQFQNMVKAIEARVGRKGRLGGSTRPQAEVQAATAEMEAFKAAQLAGNASAFRTFLDFHPRGVFAGFVRNQLERLSAEAPTAWAPGAAPNEPVVQQRSSPEQAVVRPAEAPWTPRSTIHPDQPSSFAQDRVRPPVPPPSGEAASSVESAPIRAPSSRLLWSAIAVAGIVAVCAVLLLTRNAPPSQGTGSSSATAAISAADGSSGSAAALSSSPAQAPADDPAIKLVGSWDVGLGCGDAVSFSDDDKVLTRSFNGVVTRLTVRSASESGAVDVRAPDGSRYALGDNGSLSLFPAGGQEIEMTRCAG